MRKPPCRSSSVPPGVLAGPAFGIAVAAASAWPVAGTTSTFAIPGDMVSDRASPAYDRAVERRRAVALAHHFRESEGLSIARSPSAWGAPRRRSRRTSMTRQAIRRGRSRHGTSACVEAAGPTPSRATARATPTRTARRATPERLSGAGPPTEFSWRCAIGASATASSHRPTTGRGRTRAGAGGGARATRRSSVAGRERRQRRPRIVGRRPRGGVRRCVTRGSGALPVPRCICPVWVSRSVRAARCRGGS